MNYTDVIIKSFTSGTDSYGQKRKLGSTQRTSQMFIYEYSHTLVDDIRYQEITNVGLTQDTTIAETNQVVDGTTTYDVMYVIPSKRNYQVFLKKV